MKVPIAFFIFNRPETTARVFEVIKGVCPKTLFVITDGPRQDRLGDIAKCFAARDIVKQIDWDCEVLRNYADYNMGCARRVSSGIDWVFEYVNEAIILEDDCLPTSSFFHFCENLLDRFRDDQRVMMISGNNFQKGINRTEYSYYFSRYCHTWGWATWRRAWKYYDVTMRTWPEFKRQGLMRSVCDNIYEQRFWTDIFETTYKGLTNTWDFQWHYTCRSQNGLAIIPEYNLVSNIGFGEDATHTFGDGGWVANMPTRDIWEIKHPPFVVRNIEADRYTFDHLLGGREVKKRDSISGTIRHALALVMKKLDFVR